VSHSPLCDIHRETAIPTPNYGPETDDGKGLIAGPNFRAGLWCRRLSAGPIGGHSGFTKKGLRRGEGAFLWIPLGLSVYLYIQRVISKLVLTPVFSVHFVQ
jgi:hypothetical protein